MSICGEGNIVCAAGDTPDELKPAAKYVCPADDARETLQRAIDEAGRLCVKCILLKGTYVINSRGTRNPAGGIAFYNELPKTGKSYAHNQGVFRTLEGVVEPLGFENGAVIVMGGRLYEELSSEEPFSLFYCDGNDLFGRAWTIRNLAVCLPGNRKPVIVFDGSACSALTYEGVWVTSVPVNSFDFASSEGLPVPHPESVAFRGTAGSNFMARSEWRNLAALGFGVGFDIGGEHVYCESLSALYNIWGFSFNGYRGKKNFGDAKESCFGGCFYPVYCVNLLDEHNVNMPRFGHASPGSPQSVTIRAMNIQWPNTCPGHTDRRAPDFLEGRHRATESIPGRWRGSIEYVVDHTTVEGHVHLADEPFFEPGHGTAIRTVNLENPVH